MSDDTTYDEPVIDRGPMVTPEGQAAARDKFGGINWGASFFGWLVAVALAVLLTSIAGAIAAGVGATTNVTQSEAEREAEGPSASLPRWSCWRSS